MTPDIAICVLPPVRQPGPTAFCDIEPATVVTAGTITTEIVRCTYWDPADGRTGVEVTYEVRIDGLPSTAGLANIIADNPDTLTDLALVSASAAVLLQAAREAHPFPPPSVENQD